MKTLIITQRYEKIGKHHELRDNLDVRFIKLIEKIGFKPVLMPNEVLNPKKFITNIKPSAIILSTGGDPKKKDLRNKNEYELIKFSLKTETPLIGICRGAQVLNLYFGGRLKKIKNHVRKSNVIYGKIVNKKKISVKCFHNLGINKKLLGKNLEILAKSFDESIECFTHKKKKLTGIMWHPERYRNFRNFDINLLKKKLSK